MLHSRRMQNLWTVWLRKTENWSQPRWSWKGFRKRFAIIIKVTDFHFASWFICLFVDLYLYIFLFILLFIHTHKLKRLQAKVCNHYYWVTDIHFVSWFICLFVDLFLLVCCTITDIHWKFAVNFFCENSYKAQIFVFPAHQTDLADAHCQEFLAGLNTLGKENSEVCGYCIFVFIVIYSVVYIRRRAT